MGKKGGREKRRQREEGEGERSEGGEFNLGSTINIHRGSHQCYC